MSRELVRLRLIEIEGMDVAGDLFEDAVPDALRQTLPDHHVPQRLPLEVGSASCVDDADHIGVGRQVIHGFPDLLEFFPKRLAVGVMGLVREDSQVGQ